MNETPDAIAACRRRQLLLVDAVLGPQVGGQGVVVGELLGHRRAVSAVSPCAR